MDPEKSETDGQFDDVLATLRAGTRDRCSLPRKILSTGEIGALA